MHASRCLLARVSCFGRLWRFLAQSDQLIGEAQAEANQPGPQVQRVPRYFIEHHERQQCGKQRTVFIRAMLLELNPLFINTLLSTPIVAFNAAAQSAKSTPLPK